MIDKHYRPGDILFIKIDKLPDIKLKKRKGNMILKGELSGHAHRLRGNVKILEVAERIANNPNGVWDGRIFIANVNINRVEPNNQVIGYAIVDAPAELTHEEHPTITIPAGKYEIRRQREYDADYIRFVED
ncbi:hypothetical protein ES703_21530 [subsurface metagenome]